MPPRHYQTAKTELVKKNRLAAGLLSERFPGVSGIVVHMTYYRKVTNLVLMVRTVNFFPTCHAYFTMDCAVKGCTDGGFDLASVIGTLVKSRKRTAKGKIDCGGKIDAVAAEHASILYEVTIQYMLPPR